MSPTPEPVPKTESSPPSMGLRLLRAGWCALALAAAGVFVASLAGYGVLITREFGGGVRSQDGGRTWSGHRRGALRDCHNLGFHTRDGDWAYEAGGTGGGASVSQDGGRTWLKAGKGFARRYGVACAADPSDPHIWYVSVAPGPWKIGSEHAQAHLYRLNGYFASEPIGWGAPAPMRLMPIALQKQPGAPGHLYVGLTNGDVWHSPDYGDTWDQLPFSLKSIWLSMIVL